MQIRNNCLALRLHVGADGLTLSIVRQIRAARSSRQLLVLTTRRPHLILLTAASALVLLVHRLSGALHLSAAVPRAYGRSVSASVVLPFGRCSMKKSELNKTIRAQMTLSLDYSSRCRFLLPFESSMLTRGCSLRVALLILESATGLLLLIARNELLTADVFWTLLVHSLVVQQHALTRVVVRRLQWGGASIGPRVRVRRVVVEPQVNILLRMRDNQKLLLTVAIYQWHFLSICHPIRRLWFDDVAVFILLAGLRLNRIDGLILHFYGACTGIGSVIAVCFGVLACVC